MSEPAGAAQDLADAGGDDIVLAFRTLLSRAQGRVVRLGRVADEILSRHDYPESVSRTLGEAIALSAMLGSLLHANGRLILQTRTDGPVRMLVVDYTSPGNIRAMASFDADAVAARETSGSAGQGHLLGNGHLAMTIDPGGSAPRTQGIVALANHSLTLAAHTYFRQSEQIPTFVRLAVARHQVRGSRGAAPVWHWRAGGLIVQQLPEDVGTGGVVGSESDDDNLVGDQSEDWQRTRMLAATVEDHELLDPTLPTEQLLLRLFAQEGVTVTPPVAIKAHCSCTRQRVERLLQGFGADDIEDMREPDGGVTVTCEYCSMKYRFAPEDLSTL
jgi:molecular chaperone Hsp33